MFYIDRLREALLVSGLSQEELALHLQRSRSFISELFAGKHSFTCELASEVSLVTGFPLHFFEREPVKGKKGELTYRAKARTTKSEKASISAQFSLFEEVIPHLMVLTHSADDSSWVDLVSPTQQILTANDIEHIAADCRQVLGIKHDAPIANMIWTVEKAGIAVVPFSHVNKMSSSSDTEGVTRPEDEGSSSIIGYFPGSYSGDRQRFTIAHELGHLILHRHRPLNDASEAEAQLFASAFLLPADTARRIFSPSFSLVDYAYMKAGWGISIQALIYRAMQLKVINSRQYRNLYISLSARGWRKREPVKVPIEHPLFVKQMMGVAFGRVSDDLKTASIDPDLPPEVLGISFDMASAWSDGLGRLQSAIFR